MSKNLFAPFCLLALTLALSACDNSTAQAPQMPPAKVRIEIVAPDEKVDDIVRRIISVACTGQTGDGLVWVVPIDRAVFINKTTIGSPQG